MSKINNPGDIRKTLLARGYTPLPNKDKRCLLKGWPAVIPTEEMIDRQWSKMKDKATGLRLGTQPAGDVLGAADCDVALPAVLDAILERWRDYLPDVFDDADVPLLERGTTASCKVAFFLRISGPFSRVATPDFEADDGSIHKVEIFGGASARQFGAFGAHSVEKGSSYEWRADSPLDVDIGRLPAVDKGQCERLVEIAVEVMLSKGLTKVERLHDDDDDREIVYDITDQMSFNSGDSVYSLDELKAVLKNTDSLRVTAGWHDPTGVNPTRCIARLIGDGVLLITDFGEDGRKHMEPKPAEVTDEEIAEAMAKLEAMGAKEEPINGPTAGDSFATVVAKLLMLYCYCPSMKNGVVDVLDPDHTMAQSNFFSDMAKFSEERRNQAGNIVTVNPGKVWMASKERRSIRGMQMRPDMKTLFFRENGAEWLNTYRPPAHTATGGSSALLWQFMEQLTPDPVERAWHMQYLAYKFRHPEIPGPAVIMLAQDQFGTGRGTFMALLVKLFGHVAQLPAHLFTGSSYQAQYTEWLADNVIVCVEEMVELKGGSKYAAKHDLYERLKELIEPRLKRRKIVRRGTKATDEMVSCSFYAFLNNLDDIPVHERDRRCFATRNGGPRDPAFWMAVNASIENPADVAAFAADLRSIDLTGYSPYDAPPITEAKLDMAEAAKSDIERGIDAAVAHIRTKGSEMFSVMHVVGAMRTIQLTDSLRYPEAWESMVGRLIGKHFFRVGVRHGVNWLPMFGGKRWPTYAWTAALAAKWKEVDAAFVALELGKVGSVKEEGFAGWAAGGPFGASGHQSADDDDEDGDSDDK